MTTPTPRDGREIAAENELSVLRQLSRFGWLTSRQLSRLVWPEADYGLRMAQRTLRRLDAEQAVLRRRLSTGCNAYVLGARGVQRLRREGVEAISAKVFRDLRLENPIHRAISNECAIDWLLQGAAVGSDDVGVWTEFEIQRRLAPRLAVPFQGVHRKPDLLLHQGKRYHWVEVERAPKPRDRLDTLIKLAVYLLGPQPNEITRGDVLVQGNEAVGQVHTFLFVCANDANVRACIKAMRRYGVRKLADCCPDALAIERVELSPGFVWHSGRARISAQEVFRNSTLEAPSSGGTRDGD